MITGGQEIRLKLHKREEVIQCGRTLLLKRFKDCMASCGRGLFILYI